MTHAEYMRDWRRRHPEHYAREVARNRRRYQTDPEFRRKRKEQVAAYAGTAQGMLARIRADRRRQLASEG